MQSSGPELDQSGMFSVASNQLLASGGQTTMKKETIELKPLFRTSLFKSASFFLFFFFFKREKGDRFDEISISIQGSVFEIYIKFAQNLNLLIFLRLQLTRQIIPKA